MHYKPKFQWLNEDKACAKAIDELVAHSGYTETKVHLFHFITQSGVKGVDEIVRVFQKLCEKGVIKIIPSKCEWEYQVNIVTEKGNPYSGKLYGDLTPEEKAQKRQWQKEGLL